MSDKRFMRDKQLAGKKVAVKKRTKDEQDKKAVETDKQIRSKVKAFRKKVSRWEDEE